MGVNINLRILKHFNDLTFVFLVDFLTIAS
jgi:hypothetical protein